MASFEISVPVLVVGGGACGAVAALAARDAGADVLVIEKEEVPLGTTSLSQGLMCGAGTRAQAALGIDDSADRFHDDILAKVRGLTDPVAARAIADAAGPTIDWLIADQDIPLELDVRFKPAYGHTRARVHGWMGRSGIDLVQLLHARLAQRDIDVMTRARLVDMVRSDDHRIAGVVVERPDGSRDAIGCGALILAAGGFAANRRMVRRYLAGIEDVHCHGHEGNQGEAIELAMQVGAAVADMGAYQGYAMLAEPQGVSVPPGVIVEGGLLVNFRGERFVDEVLDISGMVLQVLEQPERGAWVIHDAAIEARCAYIPETRQLMAMKAPREADDLDGLAAQCRLDPAALKRTMDDAHASRSSGRPDATGRSWVETSPPGPPYRAIKVTGALYHTQGGLRVDRHARVLDAEGLPFSNLYAGGGSARCVSGPSSWGYLPAMGVCSAVTYGRLAGQAAAAVVLAEPSAASR